MSAVIHDHNSYSQKFSQQSLKCRAKIILYFFLHNISLFADGIFLYYLALLLLQKNHGGMLCSFVLSLDSILEISIGPLIARFVDAMTDLRDRLKKALFFQIFLALLVFIYGLFQPKEPFLMIVSLLLIRFISLIDNQLRCLIPLHLDRIGSFNLMQSLAVNLFSQRLILLISSSLAVIFLSTTWFFSCSINSLTYGFAAIALILILKVIQRGKPPQALCPQKTEIDPITTIKVKKWIYWNHLRVFLAGISYGSVALILTKWMLLTEVPTLIGKILQGPMPIYTGMFLSLALILFFPFRIGLLTRKLKNVFILSFLLGLGIAIAATLPFYFRFFSFFILGLINGIALVGFDSYFQRKIEGTNFVKAMAKNQACNKAGTLISMAIIGICIDLNVKPLLLLTYSGLSGLLFSLIIYIKMYQLEKQEYITSEGLSHANGL